MVSIAAFQAVDLGSIPGQRTFLIHPFYFFSYRGTNLVENFVVQFFDHILVLLKHKEVVIECFVLCERK